MLTVGAKGVLRLAFVVGLVIAVLASLQGEADAAPRFQRVGLVVRPAFHGSWSVRGAATVHFTRRNGHLYVRAAGAAAGYNRQGRRPMRLAMAVSGTMGGYASAGTRRTTRLVVRTPWVRVRGVQSTRARVVIYTQYPDGARAQYVLRSRAGVGTG